MFGVHIFNPISLEIKKSYDYYFPFRLLTSFPPCVI